MFLIYFINELFNFSFAGMIGYVLDTGCILPNSDNLIVGWQYLLITAPTTLPLIEAPKTLLISEGRSPSK